MGCTVFTLLMWLRIMEKLLTQEKNYTYFSIVLYNNEATRVMLLSVTIEDEVSDEVSCKLPLIGADKCEHV